MNEPSKVTAYKDNIQKWVVFLYTSNTIQNSMESMTYLEVSAIKYLQDMYTETINYGWKNLGKFKSMEI